MQRCILLECILLEWQHAYRMPAYFKRENKQVQRGLMMKKTIRALHIKYLVDLRECRRLENAAADGFRILTNHIGSNNVHFHENGPCYCMWTYIDIYIVSFWSRQYEQCKTNTASAHIIHVNI